VIKKKGMPITGTNTAMRSKPPVLSDAADTSRDSQKQIVQPPQPFANPKGAEQTKTGTGSRGAVPGGESIANPKGVYAGKKGSSVGQSNPQGGAVGYSKLPNQSKQIGGRMGFPPPKRKAGAQNLSSVKRNASFYGE
jgi:hypothetical protein